MNIEPSADMRFSATMAFQIYTSYLQAGFNEVQSMELLKLVFMSGMKGS